MRILIVNNKFNNKKLSSFLMNEFPFLTQNILYKALRKKDIRINDIRVSENVLVFEGDTIKVYILDKYLFDNNIKLDIVYEDDNIFIINKPKNMEVTGDNSLSELIFKAYGNYKPCHRLDRNTKGLVIFAKNSKVLDILISKFKSHEIAKFYKCKVIGTFEKKHDILNAYLFKDNKKSMVYISDKNYKGYRPIKTEYFVIEQNTIENYSILEVILHTR